MSIKISKKRIAKREKIAAWKAAPHLLKSDKISVDQLGSLEMSLRGWVVLPTDPSYEEDRQESNPAFQAFPALIVYCVVPEDVRLCLEFANALGLWVAVRSGGHSTACYSVNDGMVIDTSNLDSVVVDTNSMTAIVGAGTNFGDLNSHLNSYHVHIPGGACQDVCVAGYMQGGGFGYTSRKFGMNCDNVLAVTVMLWDGRIIAADKDLNRDLFWAIRGGTGGNFGVLLDITYKVHDLYEVWGFCILWKDMSVAADVLVELQKNYMKTGAPDELCYMGNLCTHEGQNLVVVQGMYAGSRDDGMASIQSLMAIQGADLVVDHVAPYAEMDVYLDENPFEIPDAPPSGTKEDKQAGYIARELTRDDWQKIVDFYVNKNPYPINTIVIEPYGGAINRVGKFDTAFIHRDVDMDIFMDVFWQTEEEAPGRRAYLDEFFKLLEPYTNGHSYQNYPRRTLPNWRWAYFGDAFPALLDIKAKYDPNDFFRYQQSISVDATETIEKPADFPDIGLGEPIAR